MTATTYKRKRYALLKQLRWLDAQQLEAEKPIRRRVPSWCRPWWERRDGRQHVVYCTAQRTGRPPRTGYWVWFAGHPKVCCDTMEKAKALAGIRFVYETYIWSPDQWEEWRAAHPEIGAKLAELGME